MRITDISVTKKGRYALFVDNEFVFSVDADTLVIEKLKIGNEITEDYLEYLVEDVNFRKAREKALDALSHRSYTKKALTEKLARKIDESSAERAAERMEELGLIDDEDYARRCTSDLIKIKKYGKTRIKAELARRGLDAETAAAALEAYDDEDFAAELEQKLERKYGYPKPLEQKAKDRMIAALMRHGFSFEQIRNAMRALEEKYDL